MADETGGRLFEVSKKETLADIYKQIGEETARAIPARLYAGQGHCLRRLPPLDLSFSKSTPNAKDLYIQARDGYYVGAKLS